jgi:hypothetical protein
MKRDVAGEEAAYAGLGVWLVVSVATTLILGAVTDLASTWRLLIALGAGTAAQRIMIRVVLARRKGVHNDSRPTSPTRADRSRRRAS